MKNENRWRNRTNNERETIFLNVKIPVYVDQSSLSNESPGFCIPFYSCSSNFNRTIGIILAACGILFICLRVQCAEYCKTKKELDKQTSQIPRQYSPRRLSEYNEDDLI
jgi:hypothetical protein